MGIQFQCQKSMLLTGLNTAGRATGNKNNLAVLDSILCRTIGGKLTLTGYNLETAITYTVDGADITAEGECVFPARLFSDIVNKMPEGPVVVKVDDSYKVFIKANNASFTIKAATAADYPALPNVSSVEYKITTGQCALKKLIKGTAFAVSDNQARPVHTGVKFEAQTGKIEAVAVDGFRLAHRIGACVQSCGGQCEFVIPGSCLKELDKILRDTEDRCTLTVGPKFIEAEVGNSKMICRLLEGSFLDWRKLLGTKRPIRVVANVQKLIGAVERVGLIVNEKAKSPLRCVFSNGDLHISTQNSIGIAEDHCIIDGTGNDLEIGLNVRYLSDALKAVNCEEVAIEMTNSTSAVYIVPADNSANFTYMVLPVRLKKDGK